VLCLVRLFFLITQKNRVFSSLVGVFWGFFVKIFLAACRYLDVLKGSKRQLTIVTLPSWAEVLRLFKNKKRSHLYIVEVHADKVPFSLPVCTVKTQEMPWLYEVNTLLRALYLLSECLKNKSTSLQPGRSLLNIHKLLLLGRP